MIMVSASLSRYPPRCSFHLCTWHWQDIKWEASAIVWLQTVNTYFILRRKRPCHIRHQVDLATFVTWATIVCIRSCYRDSVQMNVTRSHLMVRVLCWHSQCRRFTSTISFKIEQQRQRSLQASDSIPWVRWKWLRPMRFFVNVCVERNHANSVVLEFSLLAKLSPAL